MSDQPALNTDRELYRQPVPEGESEGMSYYQPSVHVTESGAIGMNVGGHVIVLPIREWHALAAVPWWDIVRDREDHGEQDGQTVMVNGQAHIHGCARDSRCLLLAANLGISWTEVSPADLVVVCDCPCHNGEPFTRRGLVAASTGPGP